MAREDLGVGLGGLESGPSFYYLLTQPAGVAKPERSDGFGIPLAGLVMRFSHVLARQTLAHQASLNIWG